MSWDPIFKVINTSIVETFKSKFWSYFLGSLPAAILILFGAHQLLGYEIPSSIIFGLSVLILLGFIRFIYRIIVNSFKHLHEVYLNSSYGNAIIQLKNAFAKAHYYRKKPEHQDKLFMDAMIYFCESLKNTFDEVTPGYCSVSIKVPLKHNVDESAEMKNLCRDPENGLIRDNKKYEETRHTIIGNTAFNKVLNSVANHSEKKYYLNNSVSSTKDYESTSIESRPNGELGYESELVYPIIPILSDSDTPKVLGFLCVDCDSPNAFNENYDVAIVEGVADGIYDLMKERINWHLEIQSKQKKE